VTAVFQVPRYVGPVSIDVQAFVDASVVNNPYFCIARPDGDQIPGGMAGGFAAIDLVLINGFFERMARSSSNFVEIMTLVRDDSGNGIPVAGSFGQTFPNRSLQIIADGAALTQILLVSVVLHAVAVVGSQVFVGNFDAYSGFDFRDESSQHPEFFLRDSKPGSVKVTRIVLTTCPLAIEFPSPPDQTQ
jgi:hypothetical protein